MDDLLLTTIPHAPEASSSVPVGGDDPGACGRSAAGEGDEVDWSLCTWKGSRRDQHRTYLALPFRRKLELLEEMCDFARATLESRRRRGLPYVDPQTGRVVSPVPPEGASGETRDGAD